MSQLPPDRRRRIGWHWAVGIAASLCVLSAIAAVAFHRRYTPPGCEDPRTLALVHTSLMAKLALPDSVELEDISTIAGSFIGFRYVCEAELGGFERNQLPPNTPIPASVRYVSRLTPDGTRQAVTVTANPLLILAPAK